MTLTNTIADLISASVFDQLRAPALDIELLEFLVTHGCDYFEIIRLLASIKPAGYLENDIEALQSMWPTTDELRDLKQNTIRKLIPRWTATRYHTGPIDKVVGDIRQKCLDKSVGLYSYHSNLNPRNIRSLDDPYVLMISTKSMVFLDINRRWASRYDFFEGELENAETGSL